MTVNTVNIAIQDDNLFEIDEIFTATLELVDEEDAERLILDPQDAIVTILDDDGR